MVEAEPLGRSISFRAMIVRACSNELWLGLTSPDRRLESVRPDQPILLTIARNGCALMGRSGFLRPLGDSKSRVFAVARPVALERVQRRGFVRYPIDMTINYRLIDPATWGPRGKTSTTFTKDLSPGGVLFASDAEISLGDDLDLTLPLFGMDRVSMNGVVKRLGRVAGHGEPGSSSRPHYAEVGVKFTRITSLDQDRIVRLILLTEHRRRVAAAAGIAPVS